MDPSEKHTSNNRYLLMVHHAYSFEILRPLHDAAKARGDDVAWFLYQVDDSSPHLADARILETVEEVQRYNPTAVFAPGNWVPHFFPGIKVQVFHGLANDETGKKGHYRMRGHFDLYCTHARQVTQKYQELAQQHGYFAVIQTGWPKLDLLESRLPEPTKNTRPVLLYASTFSRRLTSSPWLVDTIEKLARSGQWHLLVTLHPKIDRELVDRYRALEGPNLEFHESDDGVIDLLHRADVMLCDTSSILLEFMYLEKPVVTFRTNMPGPHVLDVREIEDIEPTLKKALLHPDSLKEAAAAYVGKLHEYSDGRSSERVLVAVDTFLDSIQGTLKPKPWNLGRKLQIRKRLGYWKL